jgi:hypothetical protein
MTDDFDRELVTALRTLERDPVDGGRDAVTRRVRRRRARGVAGAAAVALVVGIGIGAVVARNDDARRQVIVGQSGPAGPTAPPISVAATGVLTYPTTVAPGDEFSAVLRNPLSAPNVSCFLVVRLERWDGDSWGQPRELLPEGVDPNLAGPGADCHPDLIQPGAFIGERRYKVPGDLAPGDYRIVERSTEGEGRLTVIGPNVNYIAVPPPAGRYSIDLAPGGGLDQEPIVFHVVPELDRAVVLDDDRLAISWRTRCNVPARRVDFDYAADRVTAHVDVGAFVSNTGCVEEPATWSAVVDLPAPLWGRGLDVELDITNDTARARRVEVTPLRTYVLPEIAPVSTTPPIVSTSISSQTRTNDSTQVQVYAGKCVTDAQSAVYADDQGTVYVQPYVQVPEAPPGNCAPSQTLDIPVWVSPDGHQFFGPNTQ